MPQEIKKSEINCWEYMQCGRVPGGANAAEVGICPAYTSDAGQACWLVAGTFCGGRVQGTFAQKMGSCLSCDFYKQVDFERRAALRSQFEPRVFMTAVLDTIGALVVVLDPQGHILSFNRACEQTTGYSFEEVRGRHFWDLFLLPEEVGAVRTVFENLRTSQFPSQHENHWVTKHGDRRLIAWSNTVLQDDQGSISEIIGTGIDITERRRADEAQRESAERVRLILNSTAEGIFGADTNGNVTFANPASLRMLGFDDPSQLLGRNIHFLCHHTRADGTPYPVEECRGIQAIRRRESIHVDDEVFWRSDGTSFPVEYWSYPVRRGEEVVGGVVTFVDITERQHAEDKLRQNEADLRRSHEELQALTGRLITAKEEENSRLARELHDVISQRLAVLGMEVSAVQQKFATSSPPISDRLRLMGEEIGRLAQDIHRLSRQLHPSILEHLGLMAALRAECAAFSSQHGIGAELVPATGPDSLPPEITLSLYRIAQESLWNVAKHARAQQVRLAVSQGDGELLLTVEDDGRGFEPDQVKGRGGLGLVSMEERARLVGGRLLVESHPGKGTRVEVRVPLPPAED